MKWIGKQVDSLAQVVELGILRTPIVSNSESTVLECSGSSTDAPAIQVEGSQNGVAAYSSNINDDGIDFQLLSSANGSNYCTIRTGANGETTITTVDADGTNAHLNLTIDGGLVVSSAGIDISADGDITNATWSGDRLLAAKVPGITDLTGYTAGAYANASSTGGSSIVTVGTIGTGVWQGTAVASAYLDADTAHLSTTKQLTHHMMVDDIDTTKIYIPLQTPDTENATATNKQLPILAPVAGKLLKIFLRANTDLSGNTLTWRLETKPTSENTAETPNIVGTQSGAGCTNRTMTTYDFTSSLDSGDNLIDAGDTAQISIQSDSATANTRFHITLLWEWNLS